MCSFMPTRLLTGSLAVAISHFAVAKAQCYYPGGAWAKDQFPCDKYAYTSLCCPTGWTCFSNKLCIATDPSVVSSDLPLGTAIRGTCTNPLWNDTACGGFCLNDPVSANNGSVVACGNNKWCCEPDDTDGVCNCNTGKGTFLVSDGTAQTVIGVVGLQHTSTGSLAVLSSSTTQRPSADPTLSKSSVISLVSTSPTSSVAPTTSTVPTSSSSSRMSALSSTSSSQSSSISLSSTAVSASKSASTSSITSATSTGSASSASQTNQQIVDTSSIPITQTTAFKAGVGVAAGVVFAIILGLVIWYIARGQRRRRARGGRYGNSPNGNRWVEPLANSEPYQVAPMPHPYEDNPYSAGQSRTALAEQVAHNRRTPTRPIDMIDENHPYSDRYMTGGAGR